MNYEFLSAMSLSERRLDEERMQVEQKRREREEQHLYLTTKVRVLLIFSLNIRS